MRTLAHALLLAAIFTAFVFTAREYSHRTQATWVPPPHVVTQAPGEVPEADWPAAGPVVRQGRGFAPTPHEPGPAETLAHTLAPVLGPRELPPAVILPLPKPRPVAKPAHHYRYHYSHHAAWDDGQWLVGAR